MVGSWAIKYRAPAIHQPMNSGAVINIENALIEVVPTDVLVDVVNQRAMFDLFGAMPAQQIEHHRVSARIVQTAVRQHPLAQHRGEMLQRGHIGQPSVQPPSPQRRRKELRRIAE